MPLPVYESIPANSCPVQALPAHGRSFSSTISTQAEWNSDSSWTGPSLSAARAILGSVAERELSDDANILFLLLSRLAVKEPIPLAMLLLGTTSRKRWTQAGGVADVEATDVGLSSELARFVSDPKRLDDAFRELGGCQPSSWTTASPLRLLEDGLYSIDEAVANRLNDELHLSTAVATFWKEQALIVSYRAIPWKYLETSHTDMAFFIPHLQHTLKEIAVDSAGLSTATKTDLALTLVEATRFPGMSWKRTALAQAEAAMPAGDASPSLLQTSIAQNRCVLSRIKGDLREAANSLDSAVFATTAARSQGTISEMQAHAAAGQTLVQRALNDIQVECLNTAEQNLNAWSPLEPQHPSPLEQTVLFRKLMIHGRLLRFRGDFPHSLACLEGLASSSATTTSGPLVWNEELRDLTCDLADTLRELGRLDQAEAYLTAEIVRRQEHIQNVVIGEESVRKQKMGTVETRERAFLDLCLAEVRFARGALRDAYEICVRVLSGPRLRFCTLRGHIILAKIHHIWEDHQLASYHWTEALKALSHFTLTYGYTTQVILASARESMRHLDQDELAAQFNAQLQVLRLPAVPEGGMQHWIAGMQQWSRDSSLAL